MTEYEKQQQLKKNKQKFIGAEKVAKLAKEKFNGVGPSRRKIEAAAADGQYSPGKRGKPEHMPRAVGDFLHETTTLLRCHSIPVYASVIIEQAKYLIAGTKWEDLFAFDMSRDDDSVLKWDEEKLRRWYRERLRIITTDGVGIHINPKFLQYLLDNDIRLVLRCPYSSSKTQPEDVTSFWYLKNNAQTGFYKAKQAKLASMIVSNPNATLTESDIIECTGPAWRQTFTPEKIGIGYASCGYKPNTRRPVWDLLKKERQAEKALSRASRKPNKSKPEELNFEAAIGKMATLLGVDEKAKKKAEETDDQKRARLTSGDIALIPGGANGSKAMPFAQLKAAVGEIKLMNGGPCDDTLKSIGLSTDGKVPTRRARLLLCSA
eukprot:COSAG06_NODE_1372_length_9663_cov_5.356232_11_plen_376_part_01